MCEQPDATNTNRRELPGAPAQQFNASPCYPAVNALSRQCITVKMLYLDSASQSAALSRQCITVECSIQTVHQSQMFFPELLVAELLVCAGENRVAKLQARIGSDESAIGLSQ